MYFACPVKWSLQGIWSPYPSPRFALFSVTSTLQEFSLIPQRKNETVFENLPVLHKFPITTLHFLTATTNLSNSFSGSNQSLRNHPRVLGHMSFYMGIKFVRFEQDYWQFFFFWGVHVWQVYSLAFQQDSKFMTFTFAFESSKVRTFDFVNVMNWYIAIRNYLLVFRLLFTFKNVGSWKM